MYVYRVSSRRSHGTPLPDPSTLEIRMNLTRWAERFKLLVPGLLDIFKMSSPNNSSQSIDFQTKHLETMFNFSRLRPFIDSIRLLPRLSSVPTTPVSSPSILAQQLRGMKVRSAVRKMCLHCRSVKRKGRVYILCNVNPRHKQRQG
jgi:ribosomal protein L36